MTPRLPLIPTTIVLAAALTMIGLGIWQLQRRVEKHVLIAMLNERLAAEPAALPARAQWNALTSAKDEFRRVRFTATYAPVPDAMVYSTGSAVRGDVSGPGTWAFLPAQLADGNTVVVNAGFVQNTMQARNQQDRALHRDGDRRWPAGSSLSSARRRVPSCRRFARRCRGTSRRRP